MTARREGPLKRAERIVRERMKPDAYGAPALHFAQVARLWSEAFGWDVKPWDVPIAMILLKVARLRRDPRHQDSATDIAGYIEAHDMIVHGD